MTSRTHDLAAFTTLTYIIATRPIPSMTLATAIVALGANFLGAVAPDLDQPTTGLWYRIPAGSIISRIVKPFLGSHRIISHSLLGMAIFGWLLAILLDKIKGVLLVDMHIVWWTFMFGFASHLVMDTFTKEGVPWLFPLPIRLGLPPFRFLRLSTGGMIEKGVIFPGLLIFCGYIIYTHYNFFIQFLTQLKQ